MSRPEHILPPELFYNEKESSRYAQNSRILQIQADLAQRAYDLLEIPQEDTTPKLLLDLGCGSGISGSILSEANHHWFGLDISESMLQIARENEEISNFVSFSPLLQAKQSFFYWVKRSSAKQAFHTTTKADKQPKRIDSSFQEQPQRSWKQLQQTNLQQRRPNNSQDHFAA